MHVRHHGRLGHPRIGHDQRLIAIRFQVLAQDRMVVGQIRADQQNHVGTFQIFVGSRRSIAAERHLVAGNRAGHAQRRIAVVVIRAESELHQLAERVELFGHQLAGAQHAQRFRAVLRLRRAETLDHHVERLIPADPHQLAALAQHGIFGAILGVDRVVFGKTLGAQLAPIYRMHGERPGRDSAAIFHADLDPAADRTISAGGGHPVVRNLFRRSVAGRFIPRERILFAQIVEADSALPVHAALLSPEVNAAAIFLGTTLTKNR